MSAFLPLEYVTLPACSLIGQQGRLVCEWVALVINLASRHSRENVWMHRRPQGESCLDRCPCIERVTFEGAEVRARPAEARRAVVPRRYLREVTARTQTLAA